MIAEVQGIRYVLYWRQTVNKDYLLSELQFITDKINELKDDVDKTAWNINSESIANNIGDALCKGRSGLSYFVNGIPMMEYRLNNYKESGDIEDLNSFMKIANDYMDAVVKVRESFNMLDELAVELKRKVIK